MPKKRSGNLLIGTWNIAALRSRLAKERFENGLRATSPKRDLTDLCCIAEVLVASTSARSRRPEELTALRAVMRVLGAGLGLHRLRRDTTAALATASGSASSTTAGGSSPRAWRARSSSRSRTAAASKAGLERQFARTPYAVSFAAGEKAFTLVTLHVHYGETRRSSERRAQELRAIAEWLARSARTSADEFNRNLIALGDFNIDRHDDPLWHAFASTGLGAPKELEDVPRNIAAASGGTEKLLRPDRLVQGGNRAKLTLDYKTAGYVPWTDFLLQGMPNPSRRPASRAGYSPSGSSKLNAAPGWATERLEKRTPTPERAPLCRNAEVVRARCRERRPSLGGWLYSGEAERVELTSKPLRGRSAND